jgi:superfamily II DNA or RNA helicase
MLVRVDSAVHVPSRDIPEWLAVHLNFELTLQNPEYVRRRLFNRSVDGLPCELPFLYWDNEECHLPRGYLSRLTGILEEQGIDYAIGDRRVVPPGTLPETPVPMLRDYQREAVRSLQAFDQGMAVMCCGAGKTFTGVGAMARLRTPTLVLVHTLELAEQWRSHVWNLLGFKAGLISGTSKEVAPITVALVQSLSRWPHGELDKLLGQFGLIIVDECHHIAASTFYGIVGRCPAMYRLGLTATPIREDGLSPLLHFYFGEVLTRVTQGQLIEQGVLTMPRVQLVETEFNFSYSRPQDYARMLSALAKDEARNKLITHTVAKEAYQGLTCLVLSGRVEHCLELTSRLQAAGIKAEALTSRVSKDRRQNLLGQARRGELSVLTATSLADEGLDLPRLSRVFLAFPSKAKGRTIQRLGRLMRPHPEKRDAVLFDFVDSRVPVLRRHHQQRLGVYAQLLDGQGIPVTPSTSASAKGRWA